MYVIGDIHGCIDAFAALIDRIEDDDAARGPARTTVVLLGDLIDRGPDSAGVVARARAWGQLRRVAVIMGNHEEMLLVSRTDEQALRAFLKYGGVETLCSYGVDAEAIDQASLEEIQAMMEEFIPQADFDFIASSRKMLRIGDYLFVHAGVRPHVAIEEQLGQDCRWIREPFLRHKGDFGAFVIHGHTITDSPEICPNRIGIDTGVYMSGKLTAIALEGTERWFLQVGH